MATKAFGSLKAALKTEAVSGEELVMLKELHADVQLAQAVLDRYAGKIAQKYQIGPKDQLSLETGAIARAKDN